MRNTSKAIVVLVTIIILTLLLMLTPVSTALSAGIASVSMVVFGVPLLILAVIVTNRTRRQPLIYIGLLAALTGIITPQIGWLVVAQQTGVSLRFEPRSYLHFSGSTDLHPTKTFTYKRTHNESLSAALYHPAGETTRPVVVLLHGGGWQYGNYLETGRWPKVLTDSGFAVISIEYRLANSTYHTWRDAPSDVHDALTYVSTHAGRLAIDPTQLSLLGQSAGGHLALVEAYHYHNVNSVISLYGQTDLELDYFTSRDKSAELNFVGGPPEEHPTRYATLSPLRQATVESPRTLLIQGLRDDLVHYENAAQLSVRLGTLGVRHQLITLPFTGHSFENQQGGFAAQIAEQVVVRFLQSN